MSLAQSHDALHQKEDVVHMDTYIVLLNWNGWRDTIECLESVFRLDDSRFKVVVCDNGSTDGSIASIKAWARGELASHTSNSELAHLTSPPIQKPISYCELTREQSGQAYPPDDARIILIQTGANLGYAAVNNVGLRFALLDSNCNFCWLLNNDTLTAPGALSALRNAVERDTRIGICGSLNLSYHNPTEVQAEGGKGYNRLTGRVCALPVTEANLGRSPRKVNFVNGASVLVSRSFLETVGLMEESYFLYFDELDWAMRAKGK